MYKNNIVLLLIVFISSCSTFNTVHVVESVPDGCRFIKSVGTLQCVQGTAAKNSISNAIKELKEIAAKEGGDTVTCCEAEEEQIAIAGYSSTGEISCVGLATLWGNIYSCGGKP